MKPAPKRQELRELARDPVSFLAYCGIRQALKRAYASLRPFDKGFMVFVVPSGHRAHAYKSAMHRQFDIEREEWGEPHGRIRLAAPLKRKGSIEKQISIFDLKGLGVLIANNIGEVPKDVRFSAQRIVYVDPPQARHIIAARRLAGRSPISEEHAVFLARKSLNVVVAGILRKSIGVDEISEINDLARPDIMGPSLFELPGYHDLKPWAQGVCRDVERWREGRLSWKALSRGALISGAPGTGKTLFAGAFANALGFKLVSTTIGAWQSAGHLDDTLNAMRRSFDDANDSQGAVLFVDEFDSIGTRPSRPSGHHNDQYWQIVINEFLSLMNNVGDGVVVIGATNNPSWIDPAILRAGRIENHFILTLPDASTRAEILRYHTDGKFTLESLAEIASELDGKSAATLEELVRDARKDAREENREIELQDLRAQLPTKLRYTLEQQFRLSVHEAGHALVALALGYASSAIVEIKDSFDPDAASFLGGQTSYELVENYLPTESTLLDRIAVALAGMAAEAVVFEARSLGSGGGVGSDIERATAIARRLVASYGLGKSPIFFGPVEEIAGKSLPEPLESEIVEILREQYERVCAMLADERERVVLLAGDAVTHGRVRIERDGGMEAA
jgi:cell division protease FtsH